MRNTTFCILLAAVLMLAGAVAGALMKSDDSAEQPVRNASAGGYEEQGIMIPEAAEIIGVFGAQYSEEYGQWTMSEETAFAIGNEGAAYAPLSGRVEAIEACAGGGSRITIVSGDRSLQMAPIFNVRVFEGSMVGRGDAIGSMGAELTLRAKESGIPVDPMEWTE